MNATENSLTTTYRITNNAAQGDEPAEGNGGLVLQQQWVTLTASMWPKPTASSRGWRVPSDRLPVLAAVFCGAAFVVCLLFAFIFYRCCVMPKKDKHFCNRKEGPSSVPQSQSAVYAEPKSGHNWGYSNRIVATTSASNQWYPAGTLQCTHCPGICPVPRSTSAPGPSNQQHSARKQRPISQPPVNWTVTHNKQLPLPEISEFSPQYASSSILDEVTTHRDQEGSPTSALKTRSLPAWVRSKPRPLSTEDDLNDLYAKVNFSKKRKNRMRNDEAAIIALSKSRSQYLHKDTDSLVDNEAVIVYDERTAL